ncbi:MAG TPA: phage tail protein [Porphyromonadaceae bacterium]|nr:phage tail protein [Porphyromonadaceae bacterium]
MAMHNWFECKVGYEKTFEDGTRKKVFEPYLVDALTFTEAEARIIEEITPFITGEFIISDIKRAKIAELFDNPKGDRWFKAKLLFITIDERNGKEKKTPSLVMVKALDFSSALSNLMEGMKGTMADFEVAQMNETNIMDVFYYEGTKGEKIVQE